ncbi:TetR/AcrR family transcriptional regulator [Lysinibacillus sp. NPDC059133]|uniref:TetR/AcrR family transcriptional regulator n=1 Tax=Lysinibacillus sp. NPDC059133 TaxID=3346737 RepID=UPI0036C47F45
MVLSEKQKSNMIIKRKKILTEAIHLFAEKGFEGTKIQEVAKASGVSFGSVFTYFENKETLFHAAVVEPLKKYEEDILNFNPEEQDLIQELESMIKKQIKIFANSGSYLNLVVFIIAQNKEYKDTFKELDLFNINFRIKLIHLIENGQKKGLLYKQNPTYIATAYTSLLMGLRLNLIDDPSSSMWEELSPFALQLFGPVKLKNEL